MADGIEASFNPQEFIEQKLKETGGNMEQALEALIQVRRKMGIDGRVFLGESARAVVDSVELRVGAVEKLIERNRKVTLGFPERQP